MGAFDAFWSVSFPDEQRRRCLDNDPEALHAGVTAALAEGAVAADLRGQFPCLIFLGAGMPTS